MVILCPPLFLFPQVVLDYDRNKFVHPGLAVLDARKLKADGESVNPMQTSVLFISIHFHVSPLALGDFAVILLNING